MAVECSSTKVTNMDIDTKVGYSQLFEDGSKLRDSVFALRNRPYRAATVGLGLLCVVLLAAVIGQSVHYQKVEQVHQKNLNTISTEKETLKEDLRAARNDKRNLENLRNELQDTNTFISRNKNQLQVSYNKLNQEKTQLQASQSQLQASNAASTGEIVQLKATKDQLEKDNNALKTAKVLLQTQFESVVRSRNELQASHVSVTKDRNNLQNKFNNVTRSRERLQQDYNDMIKKVEHLQDKYNFTSNEKDKIASSHQNLTLSRQTLEATYNVLVTSRDELQASYESLLKDKTELESNCNGASVERDVLKVKNDNLTAERDELQLEIEKLKAIAEGRKCPSGWRRFQYSCYFTSAGKSTWNASREYCQSKGADLAIVKTAEEMTFINGLYSSDKEVWIGLTDGGFESQWKWVDGTALKTAFWDAKQPNSFNGKDQDCVEFWHRETGQGRWNDENCAIQQNFICEM